MAVVGFEIDQVIVGGNPDGSDLSVPITAAYNHHYDGQYNASPHRERVCV